MRVRPVNNQKQRGSVAKFLRSLASKHLPITYEAPLKVLNSLFKQAIRKIQVSTQERIHQPRRLDI